MFYKHLLYLSESKFHAKRNFYRYWSFIPQHFYISFVRGPWYIITLKLYETPDNYISGSNGKCESIDPCKDIDCNNGTCNSGQCSCFSGYTGARCQHSIDDCSSDPCGQNGQCTDLLNDFNCTCDSGYTGIEILWPFSISSWFLKVLHCDVCLMIGNIKRLK